MTCLVREGIAFHMPNISIRDGSICASVGQSVPSECSQYAAEHCGKEILSRVVF